MYLTFKFIHLLGVILLVGNVTVTAVWKVFADRNGDPVVVSFGQRLVTLTDWSLTLAGVVLVMLGGYGMAWLADYPLLAPGWLLWGQLLFLGSGLIWLGVLVPLQSRQAEMARSFGNASRVPALYSRLTHLWLAWGVAATVPLVASLAVMIRK